MKRIFSSLISLTKINQYSTYPSTNVNQCRTPQGNTFIYLKPMYKVISYTLFYKLNNIIFLIYLCGMYYPLACKFWFVSIFDYFISIVNRSERSCGPRVSWVQQPLENLFWGFFLQACGLPHLCCLQALSPVTTPQPAYPQSKQPRTSRNSMLLMVWEPFALHFMSNK